MADKTRTTPAARPSITSHPLFPVIVVLWCGALFGLASLAIRTDLIESAVVASGMDGVVPMAAPPLGKTARILIALLATGLGCLVGLLVMRRFSKPTAEAPVRRRRSSATVKVEAADEPASPVALFGGSRRGEPQDGEPADEAEELPAPTTGRRRRFGMTRDEKPDAVESTPEPSAQIFNVADLDPDAFEPESDAPRWVRNIDHDEDVAAQESAPETIRGNRLFDSYVRPRGEEVPEPGFELLANAPEDDLEASAPSLEQVPSSAQTRAEPLREAPFRSQVHGSAAERISAAPLDTLSPVELLERLALTIERRRAAARASAEAAAAAARVEEETAPAPEQLSVAADAPFSPAPALAPVPEALRPVDPEADAARDEPLPGYVPPRHIGLGASRAAALPETEEEEVLEEGYSSLRNFSRPAEPAPSPRQVFAPSAPQRFDPPEAASVFPFRAQSDDGSQIEGGAVHPQSNAVRAFDPPAATSENAEAELRAALATLQRMSGAA